MSRSTTEYSCMADRLDVDYLRGLFHGAGLAVVACEPDGRIVACNPAACELFNGVDAAVGQAHVSTLFPESDHQPIEELVRTCVSTLEPHEYLTQLGHDEIGPREYAIICTPVVQLNGSLRGVSLWLRDITKRRRLQRKVKKNERLTYLGKLAGAVAHHYNNLLCSIATSVEYAMNMNTMTAMRRASQRTAEAAGRAADITRQLLAFAQADYRAGDLADLTEMVLTYFDKNEERLNNQRIQLHLSHESIPPRSVPREQFLIVLEHLVNNAIDAMPNGGTLTATLAPLGPEIICLSIMDTGSGINPDDMEHLFEPFHTTKGVLAAGMSTNAGLGLAVAHGLVSEMHGTITAANMPGHGARFDIILPINKPDERKHSQ